MANGALHRAAERQAARRARDAAAVVQKLLDYPFPAGLVISVCGESIRFEPRASQSFFRDILLLALEGIAQRGEVPAEMPQAFRDPTRPE